MNLLPLLATAMPDTTLILAIGIAAAGLLGSAGPGRPV